MKITKKILVVSMATSLALSPMVAGAENLINEIPKEDIAIEVENIKDMEELVLEYTMYEGEIVEIKKLDGKTTILVKEDVEEEYSGEYLHLNDKLVILNDESKDFMDIEDLEEGMKITRYTHKTTPVAQSLPPQLSPDVIVVNESEEPVSVNVSKFDEDLVNNEHTLKISIGEGTEILDAEGNIFDEDSIADRDLVVFYTAATKSIPAQTTPEKIIVLDSKEEIEEISDSNEDKDIDETEELEELDKLEEVKEFKVLDKVIINDEEINLEKELYTKDEMTMIPLRQIAEALDYEVKWNNDDWIVEVTKDAQWTLVTIGQDKYNFAKMLVKLGYAPEITDSHTFVPYTFLEEVLKLDVSATEEGILNIEE